jgi:predicted nucleic acid-binding protein
VAGSARRVLYLDASAIVKLVVREDETGELERYVEEAEMVTSELSAVEVPRAAHLKTGAAETIAHAEALLRRFYLVALDDEVKGAAARAGPTGLRTLDAIHLASAARMRDRIEAVVAYDRRLADAARDAGLRVDAPEAVR